MNRTGNNLAENYIKTIRQFLPVSRRTERKYLADLQKKVEIFCERDIEITISEIYDEFGIPQEVVNNYINSIDVEELMKAINIKKLLYRTFVYTAICLLTVSAIICFVVFSIINAQKRTNEISRQAQEYFDELMEER